MTDVTELRSTPRAAIVDAAAHLLHSGGTAAMTTRAVAEQAGVQPPTIYRLFGDKDGLLEAVAEQVMSDFVADKTDEMAAATAADAEPLEDLRRSWRRQIEFGMAHPAIFRLLSDPERVNVSPAALRGKTVLESRVRRLAEAGLLRTSEAHAVALIHAAGMGTIQSLLATPTAERDTSLADTMLESVLARITTATPAEASGPTAAVVTLRALTPQLDPLSDPERQLLVEWLDRIIEVNE